MCDGEKTREKTRVKLMKNTVNLEESRYIRNEQLIQGIIESGKSKEEIVNLIINDVLGNQLIDDELEENIVVSLSNTFNLNVKRTE